MNNIETPITEEQERLERAWDLLAAAERNLKDAANTLSPVTATIIISGLAMSISGIMESMRDEEESK